MTDGGSPQNRVFHGRRRGRRLRSSRQALLADRLPDFAITPEAGRKIDLAALFERRAEAYRLEIGFGAGEHLAAQARQHPQIGFIGCEAFVNGIARLLSYIDDEGLTNIRIWPDDARLLLPLLPTAAFDRVFILFPDPWPKRRHAARRLIDQEVLDALARIMADNADLRLASDDRSYIRGTLRHLLGHPAFFWTARRAADWRRPPGWPETRYEAKAIAAGRDPVYLVFGRRVRST